jgi:hypothetical protein
MPDSNGGLTVKELILRLEGKLDAFILSHENRHAIEGQADQAARGDAAASPAGRALNRAIADVASDVATLAATVSSHDRTLQRVIGALALVTTLGIGTLGLVILRLAGLIS